jgi:hypothetical protein
LNRALVKLLTHFLFSKNTYSSLQLPALEQYGIDVFPLAKDLFEQQAASGCTTQERPGVLG